MLKGMKKFLQEDKQYFSACKASIADRNSKMLKKGSFVYAFVLCFYTVFTRVTNQPQILQTMYYIFDIIHLCLCIAVFASDKIKGKKQLATQVLCICLEVSILSFFALEGVFTDRTEHSLYVPIAILLVLLLFIHKAAYAYTITAVYTAGVALLSWLYKTPQAGMHDIYIAIATFISANIGYVMIAQMRHSEGTALAKYERLSQTDQLTGIYNKAAIKNICEEILLDPDRVCPFIIIDLDDFKSVNDKHGHDIGDEVLRAVSQKLKSNFRDSDFLGRFGGDEFIVLMDNCKDNEIIKNRVERLLESIGELTFSGEGLKVQCSVGITFKQEGDTAQSIFKRADMALYQAKKDGKGKYRILE